VPDYVIRMDGLALAMRLGIHPHEQAAQRVLIDLAITVAYPAPPADAIGDVLDYDRIREDIRALGEGDGFALQETLVERIAALCLRDPRVTQVTVRSTKPDIYPDAAVGCEITRMR
jgi:dihydroneopterin aldolase